MSLKINPDAKPLETPAPPNSPIGSTKVAAAVNAALNAANNLFIAHKDGKPITKFMVCAIQ